MVNPSASVRCALNACLLPVTWQISSYLRDRKHLSLSVKVPHVSAALSTEHALPMVNRLFIHAMLGSRRLTLPNKPVASQQGSTI